MRGIDARRRVQAGFAALSVAVLAAVGATVATGPRATETSPRIHHAPLESTDPSPSGPGRRPSPPLRDDSTGPTSRPPTGAAEAARSPEPVGIAAPRLSTSEPTVLRLVYFVEADQEVDLDAVAAIEAQAEALQRFWFQEFGGTFRLPAGGVDIVHGDHPAAWYDTEPFGDDDRWYRLMNIRSEVDTKLQLHSTSDIRVITYPQARIDGRVGANRYEGAWMDGDDISCIDGLVESTPYTPDFPANCLATVAHELGHVYGLGHVGVEADCMQFGFYYYVSGTGICEFSEENRNAIIEDPRNAAWLDAVPGERA